MVERKKNVAVLTQSPALSSIIAMVLDCEEHLNVQTFSNGEVLKRHARIAPIDLIISDYQVGASSAPQLAIELRQISSKPTFRFILLATYVDAQIKQACTFANIDEVIVKPMSPLFLRDRVLAQLQSAPGNFSAAQYLNIDNYNMDQNAPSPDNIVYLHGNSHSGQKNPHLEH